MDAPELSSNEGLRGICKLFLLPVRLRLDGAGGRALFPGRITPPGCPMDGDRGHPRW